MSETATETEATEEQQATESDNNTEAATAEDKDWKAEAEKWKSLARKHEGNAKANADKARQFDELSEAQMSELEKAAKRAEQAEENARTSAGELAAYKAAVQHGLTEDDMGLLGTHGTPEEIAERAERLAARLKAAAPKTDFGGGDRGEDVGSGKQLTRDDLNRMTPEEISEARKAGRLDRLLGKS